MSSPQLVWRVGLLTMRFTIKNGLDLPNGIFLFLADAFNRLYIVLTSGKLFIKKGTYEF